MRIRKKQHPLLHGAAFLLTGGMSAPASAAMMGGKALRNRKADEEAAALGAAASGPAPARERAPQRRQTVTERLTELRRLRDGGLITDEEHDARRLQILGEI